MLNFVAGLQQLEKLINEDSLGSIDADKIFVMGDISWQIYEQLLDNLQDNSCWRVNFLEGCLEIMYPSRRHEFIKSNIGRLLEVYFEESRIRFYGLGSTTFRSQATVRGIEPDECYCLFSNKNIPDLAIEVVITSGGINALEVYQGLGVSEVWFWQNGSFSIYYLNKGKYEQAVRSNLLPLLDIELLASYVESDEPFDAVLEFRQQIRESFSV
ncbi:MAG: Uma2 family endonuclease [Okeania sp. SIO3B3]|nr:Uma2 family endonuclease [Okeania sp. SIO3B3]